MHFSAFEIAARVADAMARELTREAESEQSVYGREARSAWAQVSVAEQIATQIRQKATRK